jgi:hypothetical protein
VDHLGADPEPGTTVGQLVVWAVWVDLHTCSEIKKESSNDTEGCSEASGHQDVGNRVQFDRL